MIFFPVAATMVNCTVAPLPSILWAGFAGGFAYDCEPTAVGGWDAPASAELYTLLQRDAGHDDVVVRRFRSPLNMSSNLVRDSAPEIFKWALHHQLIIVPDSCGVSTYTTSWWNQTTSLVTARARVARGPSTSELYNDRNLPLIINAVCAATLALFLCATNRHKKNDKRA